MTTSSNSNQPNNNHHPLPPRDDRETLSALFDGELPGDAVRFALKRLDHDAGWRETCGRWQLIGDALRGEATSVAPADFAAGVMRMLASETHAVGAAAATTQTIATGSASAGSRRRWIGGAALAASVAMAAVLVVRPYSQTTTATPGNPVVADMSVPASQGTASPADANASSIATTAPATNATSLAMADPSPSQGNHRPVRAVRSALRPVRGPIAPIQPAPNEPATAVASAAPAATSRQPFHPPTDEIVTRPWPRAVLSSDAAGAMTVGFGMGSSPAPSFYPFEPRLPSETQAARPQTAEPQH